MSKVIEFGQHSFQLLPDRAVFWPGANTLIVADVHLGKAATFRELGLPVPGGTTQNDLCRLTTLLESTGASRLVVLGDLFHARPGMNDQLFTQLIHWRSLHPRLDWVLVTGNHDAHAGPAPRELGLVCTDQLDEAGLRFVHHPPESPAVPTHINPTLCGHVHPGARLSDFDGSGVTVPCFAMTASRLILPAFGRFTGCSRQLPAQGRRLFPVAAGKVLELPGR